MLHYQIEFDDYKQHLVHVTIRFLANPNQELWLPTWIPGSYLIREFSKHIESVKAYDEAGRLLDIKKTSKNRWRLFNTDHELMTIEYDVYAYDLSVRGADPNIFISAAQIFSISAFRRSILVLCEPEITNSCSMPFVSKLKRV